MTADIFTTAKVNAVMTTAETCVRCGQRPRLGRLSRCKAYLRADDVRDRVAAE